MTKFFDSYYYSYSENNLNHVNNLSFNTLTIKYPELQECYSYIGEELNELNRLRSEFSSKYKYVISFHPNYTIYKNIKDASVSLHRKKDKVLNSTMSFSIASKSRAILVPFEENKTTYALQIFKEKRVEIHSLKQIQKSNYKLFHTNNPTSNELYKIIEQLQSLNKKLLFILEKNIPFTLLANEPDWNTVYFNIR